MGGGGEVQVKFIEEGEVGSANKLVGGGIAGTRLPVLSGGKVCIDLTLTWPSTLLTTPLTRTSYHVWGSIKER